MAKKDSYEKHMDFLLIPNQEDETTWSMQIRKNGKFVPEYADKVWITLSEKSDEQSVSLLKSLEKIYDDHKVCVPIERDVISEVNQLRAQLTQSVDLNDKLIHELEGKEKEVSSFSAFQESITSTMKLKDEELLVLRTQLQEMKDAKMNERRDNLIHKWMKVYNIPTDRADSVRQMLSKFTSEDELENVEHMLDVIPGKKAVEPVPLTKSSNDLEVSAFSSKPTFDYDSMSREDKLNYLAEKAAQVYKKGE